MEKDIMLSNGDEVTIKSAWDCDKNCSLIDVYDWNGVLMAEFVGDMPDFDDEDFDEEKFIRKIEEEIAWFEVFYFAIQEEN